MSARLSSNTQAILLLTAPLIVGRGKPSTSPLGVGEYRRLARRLRELERQPADLLDSGWREILKECRVGLDHERLERLLGRGFLLGQAMERWRTRAIWVRSRADAGYPWRLKKGLGEEAPPVLYGCGDAAILDAGGLAVVGSRNVDDTLIGYTEKVGRLAAETGRTVVSGGARGIDRAAMRGALDAGGRVAGVLADGLERAAMLREHRAALMDGRLVLICPYDPAARFLVGHAMQRNKLIYALSDAALVVSSDYEKGGTWTGAVEQLDKLKLVPVYVRANGEAGKGLAGLRERGAMPWPEPKTPEAFERILDAAPGVKYDVPEQRTLSMGIRDEPAPLEDDRQAAPAVAPEPRVEVDAALADELFTKVGELIERMDAPRTAADVARKLEVPEKLAGVWLKRFIDEKLGVLFGRMEEPKTEAEIVKELQVPKHGVRGGLKRLNDNGAIEKLSGRPVRYRSTASLGPLFDRGD